MRASSRGSQAHAPRRVLSIMGREPLVRAPRTPEHLIAKATVAGTSIAVIDGSTRCTRRHSVSHQPSNLACQLQASVSVVRQRTLLYFTTFEFPLALSCKARQTDSQRCQLCYCHHHRCYCPRQTPRSSSGRCRRREIAVHAEYWRRRPLPASLTQTHPLGCSQTALVCEPYRWVAAVTTCSCRAAHNACTQAALLHLSSFPHALFLSSKRVPSSFHLKPARPNITNRIRYTVREHASPDHRPRALVVGPCYTTCNVKISTK
jgi:hypothetical protein